jgi:hypothetical protein
MDQKNSSIAREISDDFVLKLSKIQVCEHGRVVNGRRKDDFGCSVCFENYEDWKSEHNG